MDLLLDTNVFLWASVSPQHLSKRARTTLEDPQNRRFVSTVSLWEIQIKHGVGKLPLPGQVDEIGPSWIRALAANLITIEMRHLGKLYALPALDRDPFDRLLVAQALIDNMELVTADVGLSAYGAAVVW